MNFRPYASALEGATAKLFGTVLVIQGRYYALHLPIDCDLVQVRDDRKAVLIEDDDGSILSIPLEVQETS